MSSPEKTQRPEFGWRLLEATVRWSVSGVFALGLVALISAMAGVFQPLLVFGLGLALATILAQSWPAAPERFTDSGVWALVALLSTVAVVVVNGIFASEELLTGRDGGTYAQTAVWIADTGSLSIEAPGHNAFPSQAESSSPGFHQVVPGRLISQFHHVFPALLALGKSVAGLGGMFAVNPILGGVALVAFFVVAARRVRPYLAYLATLGLALSLPFTYFTRSPFSEPLMMVALFGGIAAFDAVSARPSRHGSLVCGVVLAGMMLARIDGFLILIPLATLTAVPARRFLGLDPAWFMRGVLATGIVAIVDLAFYSPVYLAMQAGALRLILLAAVASLVLSRLAVSASVRRMREWLGEHRRGMSLAGIGLVFVGAVLLGLIRPTCCPTYGQDANSWVATAQANEGREIEPTRTYSELSVRWLSWYAGLPALLAAAAGLGLMWRDLTAGVGRAMLPVLALAAPFAYYLWRPSITPDHIWAARRLVPVLLPCTLLLAAFLLDRLSERKPRAGVVLGVAAIPVLLAGAVTLMPVATGREWDGVAEALRGACESIDGRPVLTVDPPGGLARQMLAQPLRGMCGTEVGSLSLDGIRDLASYDIGPEVVIVATEAQTIRAVRPGTDVSLLSDASSPVLERTVTRPPRRTVVSDVIFYRSEP